MGICLSKSGEKQLTVRDLRLIRERGTGSLPYYVKDGFVLGNVEGKDVP